MFVSIFCVAASIAIWRMLLPGTIRPAATQHVLACFFISGALLGTAVGALRGHARLGAIIGAIATGGSALIALAVENFAR